MKKFYKNLKYINKVLKKNYSNFLYYKDDIYKIYDLYLEEIDNPCNSDNNYNYSYVSEEETINLVRMFLSSFNCDYVEKFDKADKLMLKREKIISLLESGNIDNFTKRRFQVALTNDGIAHLDDMTGLCYISILKRNTIKDAFLLLHEFVHSISQYWGNLVEVEPILSELLFSYYLKSIGYNEFELDNYWNERIELLKPDGYFIDLVFTLYLLDIFKENGFITKEMLNMDEEQFNNFVKRYEDNANMYNFVKNLGSVDFKHIMGFYKALKVYEAVSKDRLYSVFAELNGVGLWLDESEFNNYINMVIKDETKNKIRVKK